MRTRKEIANDLKTGFTSKPKRLPVLTLPIIGDCHVDFKLRELRKVGSPGMTIAFKNLTDETKALVRGIRAEHGPNEYMKDLDD